MSYDLHITKAENWWESYKQPITHEEILELINSKTCFKFENEMIGRNPRTKEEIIIPGKFIIWEKDGEKICFSCKGGEIAARSGCDQDIENFKYLANLLGARLQGDEGEFY